MITVYFDGLCQPINPGGVATYGFLVYDEEELIHCGYGVVGEGKGMTNNVAEYEGLRAAIIWFKGKSIEEKIEIKGDSMLVLNQMLGKWKVRSETSKKYVPEIMKLLKNMDVSFIWIKREENEDADELSRIAYKRYNETHRPSNK
ncbi:MAG: ribonuclease HI family protein [Methanotrichaceae archaeon]|nr:ribonuclease HI family protein [Methanotrichaceae archaeon]